MTTPGLNMAEVEVAIVVDHVVAKVRSLSRYPIGTSYTSTTTSPTKYLEECRGFLALVSRPRATQRHLMLEFWWEPGEFE
eukprot:CAMPEP_0119477374 /NCGR_PEP_ID=MMETSP1344-20130328/7537_1 /TAXON_ID=236787 /ORGANISM="Florenciella parvula, Strain CCMP2471" /LENGTH=79 /DNA_ID=CAMNT_0007511343 /DNA_START=59 /DNA_END=299 /DNA_ORIENTATION=+